MNCNTSNLFTKHRLMMLIPVVIVLKSYMNEMDKNSDINKVFFV
jgi:uncharacterized membrane protein YadS